LTNLTTSPFREDSAGLWGENLEEFGIANLCDSLRDKAMERGYEELSEEEEEKIKIAREDYNAFFEYCFRDSFRNQITQAPFHRELAAFVAETQRGIVELPNETGKSVHLMGRSLWKLGHRPEDTALCVIMDAADKAKRTSLALRDHIQNNIFLHRVFPRLRRGDLWQHRQFNVEGRAGNRNPSVQAIGINGQINGDRLTDIEIDDILTKKNTLSAYQMKNLISWVESEVIGRMLSEESLSEEQRNTKPGGFFRTNNFFINGHPWTGGDLIAHFRKKETFKVFRRKLIDCDLDEIRDPIPYETERKILWPSSWPLHRIQTTLVDQGEAEFLRTKQMMVRNPGAQVFKDAWIVKALENGKAFSLERERAPRSGERIATGVDLATSDEVQKCDANGFATLVRTAQSDRVLWLEDDSEKRWTPDEHVEQVESHTSRYPRSKLVVETNLGQKFYVMFARKLTAADVVASFTGTEKKHSHKGVEGIALRMERGEFILPSKPTVKKPEVVEFEIGATAHRFVVDPMVAVLIRDMQDYTPDDRHIPDMLAAVWKAFHYFGGCPERATFKASTGSGAKPKRRRMEF